MGFHTHTWSWVVALPLRDAESKGWPGLLHCCCSVITFHCLALCASHTCSSWLPLSWRNRRQGNLGGWWGKDLQLTRNVQQQIECTFLLVALTHFSWVEHSQHYICKHVVSGLGYKLTLPLSEMVLGQERWNKWLRQSDDTHTQRILRQTFLLMNLRWLHFFLIKVSLEECVWWRFRLLWIFQPNGVITICH